jgi:UDP-N-acetyl-D-mannosaminuronic acid dehydrogenase
MKKVCIVGMGYVGLTLAIHAVRNGYEVHGIEIQDSTYEKIRSCKAHFHEPGLDDLLKCFLGKSFFVRKDIPKDVTFDYFVVTVGTPLSSVNRQEPDMDVLYNCINILAPHITNQCLIILRSTIPVGSSRIVEKQICKINNLSSINISFSPERTAEGRALEELRALPQIISGNTHAALSMAKKFFEPLVDEIVCASSLEEAELTKLFNNIYRDASFAIANTFNQIAQSFNVNGIAAINNANYKYPRSNIPKPGFVGGPCLEKDSYILSNTLPDGDLKNFILAARKANENLEKLVSQRIRYILERNSKAKCLITGLAFKGEPETNDLRGSSAIKILNSLQDFNQQIVIHDFMNSKKDLQESFLFESLDSDRIFHDDLEIFDFIVVLNNHSIYTSEKIQNFIQNQVKGGALFLDTWDVMKLKDQFTLHNLFIENKP